MSNKILKEFNLSNQQINTTVIDTITAENNQHRPAIDTNPYKVGAFVEYLADDDTNKYGIIDHVVKSIGRYVIDGETVAQCRVNRIVEQSKRRKLK
jgi:hypothetical protein